MKLYYSNKIEAGCDEAGRGALAGPVVAASVILPKSFKCNEINDSKVLSYNKRIILEKIIRSNAIGLSIGIVDVYKIDKINILNSSILAMHKAINNLQITPEFLLIDGNRFNQYRDIKHKCIIKGDMKYQAIAAASIIAKNYRDRLMKILDLKYPQYEWGQNKGYPTFKHRKAIMLHGITEFHRKSFQLKKTTNKE